MTIIQDLGNCGYVPFEAIKPVNKSPILSFCELNEICLKCIEEIK